MVSECNRHRVCWLKYRDGGKHTAGFSLQICSFSCSFLSVFPISPVSPRLLLTTPRRSRGQQQRCLRALTDDAKCNEAEEDVGWGRVTDASAVLRLRRKVE